MTDNAPITELDLLAYADGRLEPGRARQVEAALAADPALRAKVADFTRQNAELSAQYDAYAEAPLPERLARVLNRRPGPRRRVGPWIRQAAALIAVAVAAGGGGWWLGSTGATESAQGRVLETAAALHAGNTRDPTSRAAAERGDGRGVQWFSERVSLELAVPDLRDKGFALVDKQRVELGASEGVRLRYASQGGRPVDVFLKSRWEQHDAPMATTRRGDTVLAHWLDGPLQVVVAGHADGRSDVARVARTLQARLHRDNAGEAPDLEPHGTETPGKATATRAPEPDPLNSLDLAPSQPDLLQPATNGGR